MKKLLITLMCAGLLMSSCTTYEASGAYTGSMFGNMVGSAIGGIAGGWRGHELGSLIGTVGGAAIGASIGRNADRRYEQRVQSSRSSRRTSSQRTQSSATRQSTQRVQSSQSAQHNDSGYDPTMSGDDRITFDGASGSYPEGTAVTPSGSSTGTAGYDRMNYNRESSYNGSTLIIRNAGIYEDTRDGVLTRGESCKVIFEIVNNTSQPVNNVYPLVEESTGNRHVHISPNLRIESLAPNQAIRYTAVLQADNRLRNGQIEVRVGVAQGNSVIRSQTRQFSVPTAVR